MQDTASTPGLSRVIPYIITEFCGAYTIRWKANLLLSNAFLAFRVLSWHLDAPKRSGDKCVCYKGTYQSIAGSWGPAAFILCVLLLSMSQWGNGLLMAFKHVVIVKTCQNYSLKVIFWCHRVFPGYSWIIQHLQRRKARSYRYPFCRGRRPGWNLNGGKRGNVSLSESCPFPWNNNHSWSWPVFAIKFQTLRVLFCFLFAAFKCQNGMRRDRNAIWKAGLFFNSWLLLSTFCV